MSASVSRTAIAALAFGQALVSLDASVVNVALPVIQSDLNATSAELQLIVVSYMIALAALILPIGALSDRIGRRRVYLAGAGIFVIGSLACGLSGDATLLILARALAGVGGACLMGLALAILTDNVPRERVPGIVAMWTTVSIAASAAGPFVGGLLVSGFGWRSVFLINVPLALLVLLVASRVLPDDRKSASGPVGLGAGLLLAACLAFFTLGLTSAERAPWVSPDVLVPILIAVALTAVFVIQQRRTSYPMIDWALVRRAPLPVALILLILLSLALAGALYQMSIFTQNVLGFSPAEAGAVTLAASLTMALITPFAGRIQGRMGAALPVLAGMIVAAGGLLILAGLTTTSSALTVVIGLLVLGIGLAVSTPIVQSVAMQTSTTQTSGAVSGSLGLASQVASILGVTLMGSLATRIAVESWSAGGGDSSLIPLVGVGAVSEINQQAGGSAASLAGSAYASGVELSFLVAAAVVLLAGIVGAFLLPRKANTHGKPTTEATVAT